MLSLQPRSPGCMGIMLEPGSWDYPEYICCRDGEPCDRDEHSDECPRAGVWGGGYEPGDCERDEGR